MLRGGYAGTGAAYRPLGRRGRGRGGGGPRSFAGRYAARRFAVAIVDDDRGHARGGDAIDQAIGLLVLVAGPVAGDVDAIVAGSIGRAACRERVCQYESILVGAGSLKKKLQ